MRICLNKCTSNTLPMLSNNANKNIPFNIYVYIFWYTGPTTKEADVVGAPLIAHTSQQHEPMDHDPTDDRPEHVIYQVSVMVK